MKIRTRFIVGFALITGLGFYYLTQWTIDKLRPRYLEAVEETLVDTSQILATVLENRIDSEELKTENLNQFFDKINLKSFESKIYSITKKNTDLRIYITNDSGMVLYDSINRDVGKDYSQWNNILRTLQGQYGARSTHEEKNRVSVSVLHVSAPIFYHQKIIGVITVAKPTTNINIFMKTVRPQFLIAGLVATLSVFALGLLFSYWITSPLNRLKLYAKKISEGQKTPLPAFGGKELNDLGKTFQKLHQTIQDKEYVENYVQTLTHELKSPLATIKSASELMSEEMPLEERIKFCKNIQNESNRIQELADEMLELASLEVLETPQHNEKIVLEKMIAHILKQASPLLEQQKIEVKAELDPSLTISGDPILIKQAFSNILSNAIDFSPSEKCIFITLIKENNQARLTIEDEGSGIPDYAQNRIFEKFYSLPRPKTGRKSTGLGLSITQEITRLHGGSLTIQNRKNKTGAMVTLLLPLSK